MLISACYITKNAGDFLEFSMKSVAPYVDEIIVVDDNSTDRTLKIARKYGAKIINGTFNGDKKKQRQKYLDVAKGEWIFVIDDDEVYKQEELEWLVNWMRSKESDKYLVVRQPFLHFWKTPEKIIKGHMWNMRLERIFRNIDGLKYDIHHQVSDKDGKFLSTDESYVDANLTTNEIHTYHYSYLKPAEYIRAKIRYYMLRDNPNCDESNVEEWVDKHPYFSNDFGQDRYGNNGLYVAGSYGTEIEFLTDFNGRHPSVMYIDSRFSKVKYSDYKTVDEIPGMDEYLENANKYMEDHWRFHNHLDHDRHQERIKYTAEHCLGNTVEVGCANGFSTHTMKKHKPDCTFSGVEPTDWGYNEACKTYRNIDFYKAVGEMLPFKDCSFDTVLVAEMIEHCDNPELVRDECWRVTGRRLIMTTPTKMHPDPDHKRFYSIEDMERFLGVCGKVLFSGLTIDGKRSTDVNDIYFQIAWVDKC